MCVGGEMQEDEGTCIYRRHREADVGSNEGVTGRIL